VTGVQTCALPIYFLFYNQALSERIKILEIIKVAHVLFTLSPPQHQSGFSSYQARS
jgi:hypothetical protein